MSMPKMRQYKQLDLCLFLWGNNTFFDGIKVEFLHKFYKWLQKDQNNYKLNYKQMVTLSSTKQLSKRFALNGGKWGPNLNYCMGRLCRTLKNPKDHSKPNPALINYLIPTGTSGIRKVEVTGCEGKDHQPTAICQLNQQLVKHKDRQILMNFINNGSHSWSDSNISWADIQSNNSNWQVQKITHFRFHCHDASFAMSLSKETRCIMKTDQNYVFQFANAYKIQHLDHEPILLARGTFWKIESSKRQYKWLNDQFSSLDLIDYNKRTNGWYSMTNLVEPVFIIHRCVRFNDVIDTLPREWRKHGIHKAFYRDYTFNMHQLMLEKDELCRDNSKRKRKRGEKICLPCGPVFQCKLHKRLRCNQCSTNFMVFPRSHWKNKWKCNTQYNSCFYVLDSKNGLAMTLMKTVQCRSEFLYS